jgi:HAE1 family hydrophobic/amphiphilic exporter-1
MSISESCIRRPVMTTLMMVAFVIFGAAGYALLPVAALPRVDYPTIQVTATLSGAAPETMAASIAAPLERQFATIAGIDSMTSTSVLGTTQITIQFNLNRNIDGAALDVQSAISTAARLLPPEMTQQPSFRKVNPADQPILLLAMRSPTLPLSTVDEYAETLVGPQISQLPGVAQVSVYGAQKYAVRVRYDPEALAARRISVSDLSTAVANANSNTPVGSIDGPAQSFVLQATGPLLHASQYGPIIVAYRNGAAVRLQDIATAVDSVENDKAASWLDGTRAIVLAIQRQPDANTVQVVDSVKALLATLRAQIPPSVTLEVLNDRSISIRQSVADVQFTLVLTIGLVILVIFLFLRSLTATIIPALALPVSLVGCFAGMWLLGFSIDNLSLMALTLSVGFVVDDAIVMLENIVRHMEKGASAMEAALQGSREIGFTIISMTLSLIAVFIPVLFMGGIVGRLFSEFAITISMAILISGLVSLTLTPLLCSRILKAEHMETSNALTRTTERIFAAMLRGYERTLDIVLAHRRIMLAITLATFAAAMYLFVVVPKGFFPTEDTGFLTAFTEGAQDISFEAMSERQQAAAAVVRRDPDVSAVMSAIGIGGNATSINQGRMFISLRPFGERRSTANQVIQRLRGEVTGLTGITVVFQNVSNINVGGRTTKGEYQYTIQGSDLAELYALAPRIQQRLAQIPGVTDLSTDLQIASRQAVIDLDRDRASQLGITAAQVRSVLYDAFGSRQISTIYTATNDYEVILEVQPRFERDATDLSRLYVQAPNGQSVPLDAIATVRQTSGPLTVNHQAQQPSVTFSFNLLPGTALGDAVQGVQAAERALNIPASIITNFAGTAQAFQQSLQGQGWLLLAAVLVIYMVLGVLYESFVHPLTILSGLPSAGIGALIALMVAGMPLTVIAVIGVVMLIGIVKKNAIMMIDFALERKREGVTDPVVAIRDACLLRFRPIMMTTMAALMGTLPIALAVGAGSELRQPLGVAVVGGLLVSQLLTLYITPVIYVYLETLAMRFRRKPVATPAPAPKPAPAARPEPLLIPQESPSHPGR